MSALTTVGAVLSLFRMWTPAQAVALLVAGSLLLAVAVAWRWMQRQQFGGTDSGIERCLGTMLGESGRWGGVQFLWLPVASRDDVLQSIEREADTPDAMLELLQTQAASLSGAVHWTVVQEQFSTEWLQLMLDRLSRVQVPAVRARPRQLLFALVFVGSERPSSSVSLNSLIEHVRACAAVGLVSCDPLPVAGVAPAARLASAAMALAGLAALLIPGILYVLGHMNPPPVAAPQCQGVPAVSILPSFQGKGSGGQGAAGGASRPPEPGVVDTPRPNPPPTAGMPLETAARVDKPGLDGKHGSKDAKDGKSSRAGKGEKGERPPREVSGGKKDAPPELNRPSSEQSLAGPAAGRGSSGAPATVPSVAGQAPLPYAPPPGGGQR